MTRARRDEADQDEIEADDERAAAAIAPAEELPPPLKIEAFRWVYSPGHVHLEYQSGGQWFDIPYVKVEDI